MAENSDRNAQFWTIIASDDIKKGPNGDTKLPRYPSWWKLLDLSLSCTFYYFLYNTLLFIKFSKNNYWESLGIDIVLILILKFAVI